MTIIVSNLFLIKPSQDTVNLLYFSSPNTRLVNTIRKMGIGAAHLPHTFDEHYKGTYIEIPPEIDEKILVQTVKNEANKLKISNIDLKRISISASSYVIKHILSFKLSEKINKDSNIDKKIRPGKKGRYGGIEVCKKDQILSSKPYGLFSLLECNRLRIQNFENRLYLQVKNVYRVLDKLNIQDLIRILISDDRTIDNDFINMINKIFHKAPVIVLSNNEINLRTQGYIREIKLNTENKKLEGIILTKNGILVTEISNLKLNPTFSISK